MFKDLAEIVAIPSVLGEAEPNAPFGKECRRALDWFLAKGKEYGFKTEDLNGYCGFAEYGEGEEMIGILCHLDVVPAGSGWTYPPYALTNVDGMLYGRGVVDDKGSVVMCLNALKEIKDSGAKFRKRVRIIAGCNEEHGSECIKYYTKHGEIPSLCFVPDSDFPLINSEKGILHLRVSVTADKEFADSVKGICGGESFNVVPDHAEITIKRNSKIAEKLCGENESVFKSPKYASAIIEHSHSIGDYSITSNGDLKIEAKGVSGHAMAPEKADNAIWKLFHLLAPTDNSTVSLMNQYICNPKALDELGLSCSDEKSGNLTMNMGIIDFTEGKLNFTLDMRLPLCADYRKIAETLETKLGAKVEICKYAPNLYIPEDSLLVRTLKKVYENCTGEKADCLVCGGGTYARELPNAIAFGPTFLGMETNIHNIDECSSVDNFMKAYKIYREAIIALAK